MRRKQADTAVEIPTGRWRERQARGVLRYWRDSGLSASAFARAHGLNAQRLCWWRKRLDAANSKAATVAFVPATVLARPAARISVRIGSDIEVEAADAEALPASWIAALAQAVASTP